MKRKCLFLVIALVLVFGSVSVVSAYTTSANVTAKRTSNTSANVSADVTYSSIVDTCTIKITLQEKYNGSWRTATGVSVKTVSRTRNNVRSLTLPYTFTLIKGKVYRTKNVFTSKKGSSSVSRTLYSSVF